jgi:uncharacterized protein (TIGR03435 family)
MTGTKKILIAGGVILFLIAAAVAVKLIYFPAAKNEWFQLNAQKLRQVPGGLAIVRPTHFPKSLHIGIIGVNVKGARWLLGRNVSLQQLMATAYDYNTARVELPPEAPTNNFDFLVTMPAKPDEYLQEAVRKKFGYVAQPETLEADVLALKVVDETLPGLKVSDDSEKQNVVFRNRAIDFTHMRLTILSGALEQMLGTPVVDKLGLTNFYDFSMPWDEQTQRQMRSHTMTRDAASRLIAPWGIALQPASASIQMLMVKESD